MEKNVSKLSERDGGLKNYWYIACLSSDLLNLPYETVIYDTKIVLFRDFCQSEILLACDVSSAILNI
jgi:phenylpropionate dioxygenase-like ring-hydroxylating dioxygenase large terminal subunit